MTKTKLSDDLTFFDNEKGYYWLEDSENGCIEIFPDELANIPQVKALIEVLEISNNRLEELIFFVQQEDGDSLASVLNTIDEIDNALAPFKKSAGDNE